VARLRRSLALEEAFEEVPACDPLGRRVIWLAWRRFACRALRTFVPYLRSSFFKKKKKKKKNTQRKEERKGGSQV